MIIALIWGAVAGIFCYLHGVEEEYERSGIARANAAFYRSCYEQAVKELAAERDRSRGAGIAPGEAHA